NKPGRVFSGLVRCYNRSVWGYNLVSYRSIIDNHSDVTDCHHGVRNSHLWIPCIEQNELKPQHRIANHRCYTLSARQNAVALATPLATGMNAYMYLMRNR